MLTVDNFLVCLSLRTGVLVFGIIWVVLSAEELVRVRRQEGDSNLIANIIILVIGILMLIAWLLKNFTFAFVSSLCVLVLFIIYLIGAILGIIDNHGHEKVKHYIFIVLFILLFFYNWIILHSYQAKLK